MKNIIKSVVYWDTFIIYNSGENVGPEVMTLRPTGTAQ